MYVTEWNHFKNNDLVEKHIFSPITVGTMDNSLTSFRFARRQVRLKITKMFVSSLYNNIGNKTAVKNLLMNNALVDKLNCPPSGNKSNK